MVLKGKRLGVLLSTAPTQPNFNHGLRLVEAAVNRGMEVYLYCIDDAVTGVSQPRLQALRERGLRLYACAYAAQRRQIPVSEDAIFSGLSVVSDLMAGTDRFVSFN
jgi:sulfur relay (sulfurtransferase) complex TusBCD TusD component (DsrE family)